MKRAHYVVGVCSWLAGHAAALIVGLALISLAALPRPARGQSAWPSYPNNTAISVTGGGNVGIGTTSAGFHLDVVAPANVDGIRVQGGWTTALRIDSLAANSASRNWAIETNRIVFGDLALMSSSAQGGDPNAGVVPFYINPSGNVGIGTPNPQHLLQVAGTIGAEEVLITSTGADYVFEPGYRLRPLPEIASYIEAKHHLPDIPSADEVKRKGMGVGEMETKLLAKVEELTLHLIQQDKENRELREHMTEQEKQNQELRGRIARLEAQTGR
jgi:hypothetical protein